MNHWEGLSKEEQEKLIYKSLDRIRRNVASYGRMNPKFIQDPGRKAHLLYAKTWRWLEQEELYEKYRDIFDLAICGVITAACKYNSTAGKPFNPDIHIQRLICDGDSEKGLKGVLQIKNWKDYSKEEKETLIFKWLPMIRSNVRFYGGNTPANSRPMQDESEDISQELKGKEAGNTDSSGERAKSRSEKNWGWLEQESLFRRYPDIFELAITGVITAACEYKPEKGNKFSPDLHIKRLILDGDKKKGIKGVLNRPQTVQAASGANLEISPKIVNATSAKLLQLLEKKPSHYEIAEEIVYSHFPDETPYEREKLKHKIVSCLCNIYIRNLPPQSIEEISNQGWDEELESLTEIIDQGLNERQIKTPIIKDISIDQYDISAEVSKSEKIERMEEGVKTLPIDCQRVLILHYEKGFKYEEIAIMLGVGLNHVTYLLSNARNIIKSYVLKHEDE